MDVEAAEAAETIEYEARRHDSMVAAQVRAYEDDFVAGLAAEAGWWTWPSCEGEDHRGHSNMEVPY